MDFKFQLILEYILKIRENFDFKKLHLSLTVLRSGNNRHVKINMFLKIMKLVIGLVPERDRTGLMS